MEESEQQRLFDDWLTRHRGLLFKVVRSYAGNIHDQEDLFQETITQVWNSIPRYRAECAATTWLYRVALNTALAWSRKERGYRDRAQRIELAQPTLLDRERRSDWRLDWLYERIAQLDHVDRSLTLLLLDGFSYRDMAETLGISESNVGVKINRIKKKLVQWSQEDRNDEL